MPAPTPNNLPPGPLLLRLCQDVHDAPLPGEPDPAWVPDDDPAGTFDIDRPLVDAASSPVKGGQGRPDPELGEPWTLKSVLDDAVAVAVAAIVVAAVVLLVLWGGAW